MYTEFERL